MAGTLFRRTGRWRFVAVASLLQVSDGQINGGKTLHTCPTDYFYYMFAAVNDGCVEVAKRVSESRRGRVESLILGEAWTLLAEGHENSRDCFKIRCIVDSKLRSSAYGRTHVCQSLTSMVSFMLPQTKAAMSGWEETNVSTTVENAWTD